MLANKAHRTLSILSLLTFMASCAGEAPSRFPDTAKNSNSNVDAQPPSSVGTGMPASQPKAQQPVAQPSAQPSPSGTQPAPNQGPAQTETILAQIAGLMNGNTAPTAGAQQPPPATGTSTQMKIRFTQSTFVMSANDPNKNCVAGVGQEMIISEVSADESFANFKIDSASFCTNMLGETVVVMQDSIVKAQ